MALGLASNIKNVERCNRCQIGFKRPLLGEIKQFSGCLGKGRAFHKYIKDYIGINEDAHQEYFSSRYSAIISFTSSSVGAPPSNLRLPERRCEMVNLFSAKFST